MKKGLNRMDAFSPVSISKKSIPWLHLSNVESHKGENQIFKAQTSLLTNIDKT